MNTKIGYLLLFLGIASIIFSALNIVLVILQKIEPITFYSPDMFTIDLKGLLSNSQLPDLSQIINTNTENNTPTESSKQIANSLNILMQLFLMGFIANVGSKLSNIGAQLVRPIVVQVRKTEQV